MDDECAALIVKLTKEASHCSFNETLRCAQGDMAAHCHADRREASHGSIANGFGSVMSEEQQLPNGWTWTTVGDLYDIVGGGTPSTKITEYWQGNIPWITSADILGIKTIVPNRYISEEAIEASATNLVPRGSLIVVTRVGLGKVALADRELCFSQDSQALVYRREELIPEYALYYLSQAVQVFKHENRGTTISGVTKKQLACLEFPLAPLNEQRRIVSKIEELFSDLDAGEANLRKVQRLLATYRQSVLKAAVTGELTKDWREEHTHQLESGEELLQRILAARREQWNGRGKYQEPQAPDTRNLPELPEGWVWASVDQLLYRIQAGKNFRCLERAPNEDEVGIVKISAVTWGEFDENESKTITDDDMINFDYQIKVGDFLFSRANTLELVGASVIVQNISKTLLLSDKVLRLTFADNLNQWIDVVLKSRLGRNQIESLATGNQLSMRNISQESIKKIAVPLPTALEIEEICSVYSAEKSKMNYLEQSLEVEMKRSATLRQSILKAAFSGQLVPQDPTDEPASMLLERIRAEREQASNGKAKRTGRTPRIEQMG